MGRTPLRLLDEQAVGKDQARWAEKRPVRPARSLTVNVTESLLGWQHTHPGLGVFLSEQDLFIHRNFFAEAWQIALVVDPRRQDFAFFHWRQGQVRDCGFVCVADE